MPWKNLVSSIDEQFYYFMFKFKAVKILKNVYCSPIIFLEKSEANKQQLNSKLYSNNILRKAISWSGGECSSDGDLYYYTEVAVTREESV